MHHQFTRQTFVFIKKEHTCFGLPDKDIQGKIAFHVLAIWYILARGVKERMSLLRDIFYDLELDDKCEEIFDKYPWVTNENNNSVTGIKANGIALEF